MLIELLAPNPFHRLGSDGVKKVTQHAFFKGVNFKDYEAMTVPAPYTPPIRYIAHMRLVWCACLILVEIDCRLILMVIAHL